MIRVLGAWAVCSLVMSFIIAELIGRSDDVD